MEKLEFLLETNSEDVDKLYPAIIQTFAIIGCGYLAGRLKWLSDEDSKGLNCFVGYFSLPALIVLSLIQLDVTSLNWGFLLSIFLSKLLIFGIVFIVSLIAKPQLSRAALLAIFCTQSNDFAIGRPLVEAVYSREHRDYVDYLYVFAPINLAILNPISFFALESRRTGQRNLFTILRNIVFNPIVSGTFLGIFGNLLLDGGKKLPGFLENFLETLGSAFGASALFLLGVRMVGRVHLLRGVSLLVPAVVIMVKLLVLPLVIREAVILVNPGQNASETADLSTFGFLYGTFPSAPAVFVFATQYGVDVDLIASSMVACTFVSAPFMFVSAKMITLEATTADFIQKLNNFSMDFAIFALLCSISAAILFIVNKRWRRTPHNITLYMIISQILSCVGIILWNYYSKSRLIFVIFLCGVYGTRIWTAILSFSLLMLQLYGYCYAEIISRYSTIIGYGVPIILSISISVMSGDSGTGDNPNFFYNFEAVVSIFLLIFCLLITAGCLIFHQRYYRRLSPSYEGMGENNTITTIEEIEDLVSPIKASSSSKYIGCSSGKAGGCSKMSEQCKKLKNIQTPDEDADEERILHQDESSEEETEEDPQIVRHIVLLLMLLCSMFVALALCLWTFMTSNKRRFSGVYFELSFLDAALLFGQSVVTLCVFGVPIQKNKKLIKFSDDFHQNHIEQCKASILKSASDSEVFRLDDLIGWMMDAGLASDDEEAVRMTRHLIEAKVIEKVEENSGIYRFLV